MSLNEPPEHLKGQFHFYRWGHSCTNLFKSFFPKKMSWTCHVSTKENVAVQMFKCSPDSIELNVNRMQHFGNKNCFVLWMVLLGKKTEQIFWDDLEIQKVFTFKEKQLKMFSKMGWKTFCSLWCCFDECFSFFIFNCKWSLPPSRQTVAWHNLNEVSPGGEV